MEIIESIVASSVFILILTISLPIVLLPFIMRFVVSNLVISVSRKKYMSELVESMERSSSSQQDTKAIAEVIEFAKTKLARYSAFRMDIIGDVRLLLTNIKNVYESKSARERLTFPFSVARLIECSLLAFSDLYSQYEDALWFKLIRNMRLVWFVRFSRLKFYWDAIFKVKFLEGLRSTRIIWRLLRVFLIPLLGIPFLLWYLLQSIFVSVFIEGAYRFFYSLVVMRTGYYAIHVFGRTNQAIEERLKLIRGQNLESAYKHLETMLDPRSWGKWSRTLPLAVDTYAELLAKLKVESDRSFESEAESVMKKIHGLARRLLRAIKRAYAKGNPFLKGAASISSEVLSIVGGISTVYRPGAENPLLFLRLKEAIAGGYFASLIAFYLVRKTPLLPSLLDKISVEFVLTVSGILGDETFKAAAKGVKKVYDSYQIASLGYKAYRLFRGISGPVGLILSATSPVAVQQILDLIKENIFHTTGRLTILLWEADRTKRNLLEKETILIREDDKPKMKVDRRTKKKKKK
jgi:hypothetical protein